MHGRGGEPGRGGRSLCVGEVVGRLGDQLGGVSEASDVSQVTVELRDVRLQQHENEHREELVCAMRAARVLAERTVDALAAVEDAHLRRTPHTQTVSTSSVPALLAPPPLISPPLTSSPSTCHPVLSTPSFLSLPLPCRPLPPTRFSVQTPLPFPSSPSLLPLLAYSAHHLISGSLVGGDLAQLLLC